MGQSLRMVRGARLKPQGGFTTGQEKGGATTHGHESTRIRNQNLSPIDDRVASEQKSVSLDFFWERPCTPEISRVALVQVARPFIRVHSCEFVVKRLAL